MYTAGDLKHEFTPEFSWLVLIVLVGILVVGFFVAMANVDYRRTVEEIFNDGKKITKKTSIHVYTAPTILRVMYAVAAYIACEVVVLKEHGDGILQLEANLAGAAASEVIILISAVFFTGLFSLAYAGLAYAVFGLGTKVKLDFVEIFAIGKVTIVTEERPPIISVIISNVKRKKRAARATRKKSVAKRPSVPARKVTRVATRSSAV